MSRPRTGVSSVDTSGLSFESFPDVGPSNPENPEEYDEASEYSNAQGEEADLEDVTVEPVGTPAPSMFQGLSSSEVPDTVPGRPTTPPIWKNAQLHPSAPQLRVWKMVNGVRHLVGPIDSGASEEEFIRVFIQSMPMPGEQPVQFIIRPIDALGHEIGREVPLSPIPAENVVLAQVRAALARVVAGAQGGNSGFGGNGGGFGGALGGAFGPVADLYKELLSQQKGALELQRAALDEERRAMQAERERLATDRTDLAARAAMTTESALKGVMEREAAQHERAMEQQTKVSETSTSLITGFFTTSLQAQQEQARRDAADTESRRRKDAEDAEARRTRDRDEWERRASDERERRAADAKEAEDRRAAERARDRAEAEAKEARLEREHKERMAQLAHDVELRKAEATEKETRLEREHKERLEHDRAEAEREREHQRALRDLEIKHIEVEKGNPNTLTGLMATVTGLLGTFGVKPADLIGKFLSPDAPMVSPELLEVGARTLQTAVTAGADVWKSNIEAKKSMAIAEQRRLTAEAGANSLSSFVESTALVPAGTGAVPPSPVLSNNPAANAASAAAIAQPQAPAEASSSGLAMATLKSVRREAALLVQQCRSQPETEWFGIVAIGLQKEPKILDYCKETSVANVLREAGADEGTISKVLTLLQQSNAIPSDIRLA